MTKHLYLSLIQEALIASMLSPDEFGTYYAVGSHKTERGQVIFAELDPAFRNDYFKIEQVCAEDILAANPRFQEQGLSRLLEKV